MEKRIRQEAERVRKELLNERNATIKQLLSISEMQEIHFNYESIICIAKFFEGELKTVKWNSAKAGGVIIYKR